MEAAELALFMISACVVVTLLEYPGSGLGRLLPDPFVRRVLAGMAMGATAIAIIYSPWGQQSGAHFNPSVTLTFLRLGKVAPWDGVFYMIAHFVGACSGVLLAALALGNRLAHPAVHYVATVPGPGGVWAAFLAEGLLSFVLMSVVLTASNTPRLARYTGVCCGILVALYISLEAPISGMSINPARTFGSAAVAQVWAGLWLYFTAPPLGMLLASEVYLRLRGATAVDCAKLHHQNTRRCIFCEQESRKPESRKPDGALWLSAFTL